ncbi:protein kinase/lanthionine synthetase C family protein [Chitinophaga japonensis]|uniref:Protein kinase-like protein n=1 Tax=Chitinophaga japonensis TaxID=104662 RepID=A0A562SSX9_CHIJA|nr:protein kinase/lanthionine synthetase C family protein [Chitinophaga japonensis]TWI84355.1 protein kinase-like protein [Chitinophaga japonensis]
MNPQTVSATTHNTEATETKGKVEKKSGKRIGYNYIILKSLKKSQKNDVVKCIYIKGLTNFGICVIKEGSFGDSMDKYGRDIRDRLIWQKQLHETLHRKIPIPGSLGSFEENGNYYLILERVKGKSLHAICKEKNKELRKAVTTGTHLGLNLLDYLLQIVSILDKLHYYKIIHRDVTVANFMVTPTGKVTVIDMELSYSLQQQFPSPPFTLGTFGFMSPEQEATQPPTVQEDIFSVGAIILLIWSGIWPNKLTNGTTIEELTRRVFFLVPDERIAKLVLKCIHPVADQRPDLKTIFNTISEYREDLQKKRKRSQSRADTFHREEILDTIQRTIGTIHSPLMADEEGWFSDDMNYIENRSTNKIYKVHNAGFSYGASGIIYALSKARSLGFDVPPTSPEIKKGLHIIEERYIEKANSYPGLFQGGAGIASSLATAIQCGLIAPDRQYTDWIEMLLKRENKQLNLAYGAAGQGMAHLLCRPYISQYNLEEHLISYADQMLEHQEKDGSWIRSTNDKKKKITKGFAHGVAGIVYYLLEVSKRYQYNEAFSGAQKGLKWLLKKSINKSGALIWLNSENKSPLPPWWSDGGPGIALSFITAYAISGNHLYKECATKALQIHDKYILHSNLSQYQGLSGLGEIYLTAFHLLNDQEWLDRAAWIAQVIMHLKKENTRCGPYWLVGNEPQPVANFMGGNCGILHFLMRYCYPDKLSLPLITG